MHPPVPSFNASCPAASAQGPILSARRSVLYSPYEWASNYDLCRPFPLLSIYNNSNNKLCALLRLTRHTNRTATVCNINWTKLLRDYL